MNTVVRGRVREPQPPLPPVMILDNGPLIVITGGSPELAGMIEGIVATAVEVAAAIRTFWLVKCEILSTKRPGAQMAGFERFISHETWKAKGRFIARSAEEAVTVSQYSPNLGHAGYSSNWLILPSCCRSGSSDDVGDAQYGLYWARQVQSPTGVGSSYVGRCRHSGPTKYHAAHTNKMYKLTILQPYGVGLAVLGVEILHWNAWFLIR